MNIYLELGFRHIADLAGYDHILFVTALAIPFGIRDWRRLAILVTAFTVGHSVTLALAMLRLVSVSSQIVETLIPATILVTALGAYTTATPQRAENPVTFSRYGMALFFGLALLKRYAELVSRRIDDGPDLRVRAYRNSDATLIAGLGIASGGVAVAVLALYPVVEPSGFARWPVWCVCALLLYWTGNLWLTAHRGGIHDDPVSFALRDPLSRVFGLLTLALLMLTP